MCLRFLFLLLLNEQVLLASLVLLHMQLLVVYKCLLQLCYQHILPLKCLPELLVLKDKQLLLLDGSIATIGTLDTEAEDGTGL